jgi:hypothetical protein
LELLLILSALLSALTGATGTRVPGVQLHQAAAVMQAAARIAPTRSSVLRPSNVMAALVALCRAPDLAAFALAPASPLYATRRRE